MSNYINKKLPKELRLGQVGINTQNEKITIIIYRNARDIDVQFEDKSIAKHKVYSSFLSGSIPHPIRYEESFAYHIEVELGLDINKIWNFKKNIINPYEIRKQSHKKIWIYCQEKDYHNDNGGYEIGCDNFYSGHRCSYCGSTHKVHKFDSLGYLHPQIAQMIVDDKRNNLTMEDMYEISYGSERKFYFKCNECKKGSSQKKTIKNIANKGFSCEYCSDGISIPNKMLRQISEQLGLNWQFEHMEDWLGQKRLDAYDDDLKIAIEMDGNYGNHEENKVDKWKDEQCLRNGIYIIRINLMDNEYDVNKFEYIKRQILNSPLALIYNFSNFDWELAWKNSLKNLVWEVKRLVEEGYNNEQMAKILNISKITIIRYKKQLGIKTIHEIYQENLFKTKELIQQNKSTKEIAEILKVSTTTIRNYKKELNL